MLTELDLTEVLKSFIDLSLLIFITADLFVGWLIVAFQRLEIVVLRQVQQAATVTGSDRETMKGTNTV